MNNSMILRSLIICEEVNIIPVEDGSHKVHITQPVLHFLVPFIPTQLSYNIVVAISHYPLHKQHNLIITVRNSLNGKIVHKIPWTINDDSIDELRIPPAGVMISSIKNVVIENEGRYIVEVYFEDECLGSSFFEVYLPNGGTSHDYN